MSEQSQEFKSDSGWELAYTLVPEYAVIEALDDAGLRVGEVDGTEVFEVPVYDGRAGGKVAVIGIELVITGEDAMWEALASMAGQAGRFGDFVRAVRGYERYPSDKEGHSVIVFRWFRFDPDFIMPENPPGQRSVEKLSREPADSAG